MIVPAPLEKTLPLLLNGPWMDGSAPSLTFPQWRQSPLKAHLTRALSLDLIQVVIRPRDILHPLDRETQVLPTGRRCGTISNLEPGTGHSVPASDCLSLQTHSHVPRWVPPTPGSPSLLPAHPCLCACAAWAAGWVLLAALPGPVQSLLSYLHWPCSLGFGFCSF